MNVPVTAAVQPLDPLRFPLHGQRLIEASAGTGKTYTIALLVLRLVLQHGDAGTAFVRALTPPEILVVTFTEAATQELRERIRARLDEAARVFAGEAEVPAGDVLAALRDGFAPDAWAACAHRLRVAAQWMDEAAVATIHGWAWRMLREHAFDSGSLFRQTLQTDQRELQQRVLLDHWRRHYYPLDTPAADVLQRCFDSPAALWLAVEPLLRREDAQLQLQGQALADAGDALAALHQAGAARREAEALQQQARALWLADRAALERLWHDARPHLNGNSYRGKDDDAQFAAWLQALADWAGGDAAPDHIGRFGLQGAKLKKGQALPPHPALLAIDAWLQADGGLDLDALRAQLAAHAAAALRQALAAEKLRRAELGFDDLLLQLDRALQGTGGAALAARIRAQFPLALIDEFQDTDPVQYRIFRRIYATDGDDRGTGLVMIGDPKQAIYGFRGADIRTYLRARRDTIAGGQDAPHAGRAAMYALDTNYRSTAAVVRAVNHVFLHAEAQPRGAFRFAQDGDNPVPFVPVQAQGRREQLQIDGRPAPALTLWSLEPPADADKPRVSSADYRARMADIAASAVVHWLRGADAGRTGFATGQGTVPLRPADIAVLVRSGTEADAIRGALAARGLRSVYLSDRASVFATVEAQDMLLWLRACALPGDEALVRSALATRTMGLPLAELARLREDELGWEVLALRFRALREIWQRHGVLPMLHQLLHDFGLPARWLAQGSEAGGDGGGERRLTNVLHLAEWLQRRAVELDGEHALLRALAERLARPEGEEDILRLESDAALIKVVTIHKSKGLEYPLVLLPFITAWRETKGGRGATLGFHDTAADARVLELDGRHAQAQAAADEERLAEDLRLLYVALTRARHGLWLGVAPLAQGNAGKPQLHRSALGHVLSGGAPIDDLDSYRAGLQALAAGCADIALVPAPAPDALGWHGDAPPPLGAARQPRRAGHAPWWIASYSALVQQLGSVAAEPEDAQQDQALEEAAPPSDPGTGDDPRAPAAGSWHAFPRGAEPGSFLHGLLEWCAQQGFAQVLARPQPLRDLVARRCAVRGWEAWIDPLCAWVPRWLALPLALPGHDRPAVLGGLTQLQTELEFWFTIHRADTRQIDALVTAHTFEGAPRPALAGTQLAGMLKGFMDLVFEHEGRYWVADYKSNWLGPDARAYDAAAMRQALLAHRYDVQYVLYVFALHRLLAVRLPDYDYDRHIGGALYLFLRGADADTQGLFATRPPRALVEALDRLFRPAAGGRMNQADLFDDPPASSTRDDLLADLAAWVEHGWLRELDRSFALFLLALDPAAGAPLLLAAALASHQLGRGHVCLDLAATLADSRTSLSLPPAHAASTPEGRTPAQWLQGLRLDGWREALRASHLCEGGPGSAPLVLQGPRLYLRRYWQHERDVRALVGERLAPDPVAPAGQVRPVLDALFTTPATPAAPDWQKLACALALRQRFAIVTGGPGTGKTTTVVRLLALLQSMATGSGGEPLRIRLAAPTGKAAARLSESIRGALDRLPWDQLPDGTAVRPHVPSAATTLHRLLGSRPDSRHFRHHAGHPLALDVLVVDEASMVDLEMMARLLQALPPAARLVLLGDKDQLASVEAGAVLGELCNRAQEGHYDAATVQWLEDCTGQRPPPALQDAAGQPLDQAIAMLRVSHRFTATSGIGQLAQAVNAGDARTAQSLWRAGTDALRLCRLAQPPAQLAQDAALRALLLADTAPVGHAHYLRRMHATRPANDAPPAAWDTWAATLLQALGRFQLLCALREGPWGVDGLNATVAELLRAAGLLQATQGWFAGRPVLVTRNDYALGLMNGDVGLVLDLPGPTPDAPTVRRVAFPAGDGSGAVRWVLPARLQAVETVFAMTVHKSQGSEFEHAALVLPEQGSPVLTRELVYTGITRAKAWCTLAGGGAAMGPVLADAIGRRVLRASGLVADI